ncbi:MAG TPA: glycosyltransferase family 2 protein [Acidimicrobiales bacterium]|nr:glycosyltransferase family 2 protein [Acidimicrobiales bacterium]
MTAVIVNYNSAPDIFECLDTLRAGDHPVELVVVDNASTDGSPEQLEALADVHLVRSARNVGFSGGVNLGVRTTGPEGAVLLVNPDATLDPGAVARLVETLEAHPRAAAVGPLVLNPDGTVQPSKRRFPTWVQAAMHATVGVFWPGNPGTRAYVCADLPEDRPSQVGWLSASVLLVRADAFRAVGMFDERFFFYVEDLDLCRRFADAGWELWFEPRAEAVHAWGGSTRNATKQLWQHHTNLYRYVRKHSHGWRRVKLPVVALGLAARFGLLYARLKLLRQRLPAHSGHARVG